MILFVGYMTTYETGTLYCIYQFTSLNLLQVITVSGAQVTMADKMASNGIIHVVDKVMLPPYGTVVDTVKVDPMLSTLLTAVQAANITSVLAGAHSLKLLADRLKWLFFGSTLQTTYTVINKPVVLQHLVLVIKCHHLVLPSNSNCSS